MGLAHLHGQNIVHRDIKPHNILCARPESASPTTARSRSNDPTSSSAGATCKPQAQCAVTSADVCSLPQLGSFVLKISDMGLSKQLSTDEDSFPTFSMSMPSHVPGAGQSSHAEITKADTVGTIGWQAPEVRPMQNSVALLLLYYYLLCCCCYRC